MSRTIPDISFQEAKGSDFFLEFIVEDADNVEDHKLYFRMADGMTSEDTTLIAKNTDDPGDVIIHFQNRILVHFISNETDYASGIEAGQYYIECTLEDLAGHRKLAGRGMLTLIDTNIKIGS
jgi:hypothetical protein